MVTTQRKKKTSSKVEWWQIQHKEKEILLSTEFAAERFAETATSSDGFKSGLDKFMEGMPLNGYWVNQ